MADAATAVRKLQSGQPLTDAEKKLLGISVTPTKKTLTKEEIDAATAATIAAGGKSTDPANRLPGETASQANARITQGYKDQAKPDLTKEGAAAGATIEFVRTGAGGVGTYKEVFPIGAPIPTARTTESGNVYDEKGNLVSGSGLKTVTGGTKTPAQLEAERLQKIADEALAKSNASQAALKRLQDIQAKLARGETLTAEEYALIGVTPPSSTLSSDTQPGKAWVKGADGKWVKPAMPTDGKTYSWNDDTGWVVSTDATDTGPIRPIGTPQAFVYDPISKTWKMPPKPTEAGNWTWDNNAGWTNTLVTPGPDGMEAGSEKTLAIDTFKNTLALYFGAKEMSQPWANALFKSVSSFYKTGATIDEALNLALQDVRNNPELKPFTDRFAGVFALTDRRARGEAIDVPTIAEFFKSQETLGDRLRQVGLADLATNEVLGEVLGTGKSVAAVLNLVNDVFMAIDNAPEQLKKDLAVVAPGADRTSIAKALLLGKRGADELEKQIREVTVLSAAKSQGIGVSNAIAADYAARGFDYGQSLEGFGTVAKGSPTLQKLTEISTQTKSTAEDAQKTLMKSIFEKDVKAQEQLRMEAEKEVARFGGASGTLGSRSLASRNRANRVI